MAKRASAYENVLSLIYRIGQHGYADRKVPAMLSQAFTDLWGWGSQEVRERCQRYLDEVVKDPQSADDTKQALFALRERISDELQRKAES